MSQFIRKPVELSPRQFSRLRSESWFENSDLWARYVTRDEFRQKVFEAIKRLLLKEDHRGRQLAVADFGCGEGSLLSMLASRLPTAKFFGIDNCGPLLSAMHHSPMMIEPIEIDMEDPKFRLECEIDVAVAAFSLIEIVELERCLTNVSKSMRAGGAAIIVVLDPAVEVLRMVQFKYGDRGIALYEVMGELVLASHFKLGEVRSPRPYFRFLRSIDRYVSALLGAGLRLEKIDVVGSKLAQMSDEPRAVIVTARK